MKSSTLKQDILDKSVEMISKQGSDNFSVRILSKALNVSHNALYKHYSSKQEVLIAVAAIGYLKLGDIYIGISNNNELDHFNRLKECTYACVRYIVDNSNIYKLMVDKELTTINKTENLVKAIDRNYSVLIGLAQKAIEDGHTNTTSPYSMVNTAWAVAHGIALLTLDNQFFIEEDLNSIPKLLTSIDNKENFDAEKINLVAKYSIESVFNGMKKNKE